jgi:hypothetical protein
MPPRVLRSTVEPSDRTSVTPAPPSRASSAAPSIDSTLTDASTIQQDHQVNPSMSSRQALNQPTSTTASTQSIVTTGDSLVLNQLMDMAAALQNQIYDLQQERAVPQPIIRTTSLDRDLSLPLDDEEPINSNLGTPPIVQPAIRDDPPAPTSTTSNTASQRLNLNSNTGHKLKASDFPNFYGKDNEDIDEWI